MGRRRQYWWLLTTHWVTETPRDWAFSHPSPVPSLPGMDANHSSFRGKVDVQVGQVGTEC